MSVGPVVPPRAGGPPRQLVLLLHGYGADGADLIGLAGPLGDVLPNALFAAPNAPRRCAQNPFGFEWFPIDFNDMMGSVQAGLPTARPAVLAHLEDAWARTGLGPAATFLIGFSQGAMLALHVGLSLPEPVLGIVSFSGALVPPPGFGTALAARPPVCLVHGDLATSSIRTLPGRPPSRSPPPAVRSACTCPTASGTALRPTGSLTPRPSSAAGWRPLTPDRAACRRLHSTVTVGINYMQYG